MGVEPTYQPWEGRVIPIYDSRSYTTVSAKITCLSSFSALKTAHRYYCIFQAEYGTLQIYMNTSQRKEKTHLQSLFYIYLSNILFAATALIISLLSKEFDGYFTTFSRFAAGLVIGLVQLAATKTPFKIVRVKPWLGRGFFGSLAMMLYYVSISIGSPGRATFFNNSFPIFVAIIAIVFLKDKVRITTLIGILIAFTGMYLVLSDDHSSTLTANIIGISSGFFAGISYHFNKRASLTEHPVVIYLGVCIVGLFMTGFSVPQAVNLDLNSVIILILAAAGAYFAQIALTIGLRDIPITEGSIHTFVKIPMTSLGALIFFNDPVTIALIAGTMLLFLGIFLDRLVKPGEKNPQMRQIRKNHR